MVALLTILYAFSFLDRLSLALLASPVSAALHLSDGELGILMGAGFALVYSVAGLPLAQLIDRGPRIALIGVGVLIWGAMTALSAFARTFEHLLVARAGVALGEAVLMPGAISLIADIFPRDRRAAPTAIFGGMASIMGPGAFIVGGAALAFSSHVHRALGVAPWQATFILLGLPSMVMGVIFLITVRDPGRSRAAEEGEVQASVRDVARHLRQNAMAYGGFYCAAGLMTIVTIGTLSWMPTAMARTFGIAPATASLWFGLAGMPAGLLSALTWPMIGRWLERRWNRDAMLSALLVSSILASAALTMLFWLTSFASWIATAFAAIYCLTAIGVLGALFVQSFAPPTMRARIASLYILAAGLVGYALGPLCVAGFAAIWGTASVGMGYAIASTALCVGSAGSIACFVALQGARTRRV